MTDIWETKNINPMLIGSEGEPFDSEEYIYELKLDGERCIAYLDKDKTEPMSIKWTRKIRKN